MVRFLETTAILRFDVFFLFNIVIATWKTVRLVSIPEIASDFHIFRIFSLEYKYASSFCSYHWGRLWTNGSHFKSFSKGQLECIKIPTKVLLHTLKQALNLEYFFQKFYLHCRTYLPTFHSASNRIIKLEEISSALI